MAVERTILCHISAHLRRTTHAHGEDHNRIYDRYSELHAKCWKQSEGKTFAPKKGQITR